jgi:nondiscriminating aspartyl-tRNA synthetase
MQARSLQQTDFEDYLQCFKYGMPPHGGLAIGLERLAKQLLGLPTVKLASLFPRDINRLTP